MIRRSALLVTSAALALTCAACTSSGGGDSGSSASGSAGGSASAAGSSSSAAKSTPITQPKSVPVSVPNATGVIKNKLVALTSCKAVSGGWQAVGTAKPRSGKETDYTVTVFFTTDSATVQAFGQAKVSVAKGRTAQWTVTSKFVAAPGTLCVLRGAG